MDYDFDSLESRRTYLSGTVPFPAPFPTVGTITFRQSTVSGDCRDDAVSKPVVVVEEPTRFDNKVVRTLLRQDVAALFMPDPAAGDDWPGVRGGMFVDFEKGTWYLGDNAISDIADRVGYQSFPGIVFVAAHAPVFARIDITLPAAESCLVDLPLQDAGCLGCNRR